MYKNNFLYISLPSHMNAIVRLKNEYKNLQKKLPYGCYINPVNNNWYVWEGQISIKHNYFKIRLEFNAEYPINPPTVKFISKVYNPNVYSTGDVCLDIVNNKWQASLTILDIIFGLIQLLEYPNPSNAANIIAGELFLNNKMEYLKQVEQANIFNKKYNIVGYVDKNKKYK